MDKWMLAESMNYDICRWLSGKYHIGVTEATEIVDNKSVYCFLLVWSTMERKVFGRNCGISNIKKALEWLEPHYDELQCEEIFNHFFARYQSKQMRDDLLASERKNDVKDEIKKICKRQGNISDGNKLYLMMYVAYRFRNNLFHGNKEFSRWLNNNAEIELCINLMMKVTDLNEKHPWKKEKSEI